MDHKDKTKEQLIAELSELRKKTRKLQASDDDVKRIEEALRKIRDYNPALLNTIGMNIIDLEGTILLTNKEMETVFGKDAIGKKCWELYKDNKKQCTVCHLKRDFKLGETDTVTMEGMFGGKIYQITHTGIKFKGNNAVMEMFQDITEHKHYEAELKTRATQQEIVANLSHRALSGENLDSLFNEAVSLVAQGLGLPLVKILEHLPDRNVFHLRAGIGWKAGYVNVATIDAGVASQSGYTILVREPVIVEDLAREKRFSGPPLLREHDVVSGMSVIIQGTYRHFGVLGAHSREKRDFSRDDIHFLQAVANVLAAAIERKRNEEELIKVQKLESVGILAGGIAHDFNNLLTGILGNISIVKLDAGPESHILERLSDAENATLRARDLTQQLLTFSHGGAPVKETLSLPEHLRESVGLALTGSNVRCDFSIHNHLHPVEVDAGQISQVIYNLLINADQAMPEGGVIEVKAENITIKPEDGLPLNAGSYVKIDVIDQGKGISQEELPKVFDPYFTTHELGNQKGRGLGLAISYSIIKEHNGYIDAESQIGDGSTFTILLPASEKEISGKREPEKSLVFGKGKILVMDDEEVVREVASDMLTRLGYETAHAADGSEALALYQEALTAGVPFDAVIIDVTIPGGMGGKETIERLLAIDPEVKAVVSSGYSNIPTLSNYKECGFLEKMKKPYSIQQLSYILQRLLSDSSK